MKNATKQPVPVKPTATKPPATTGKALAVMPPPQALAVPQDLEDVLLADQGSGTENIGLQDVAVPRLKILQQLSPEVNKRDTAYLEGAEPGMILDTVNKTLYDGEKGILGMFISYRRTNIEWIPRTKGGGFVADHGPDGAILATAVKQEDNSLLLPNGNEIEPTAEYFCFLVNPEDGSAVKVLIGMSKSQMKHARQLNTWVSQHRITVKGQSINPPMFYRLYHITTSPEENKLKQTWMGWKIDIKGNVLDEAYGRQLYLDARSYRDDVNSGKVKAAAPVADADAGETDEKVPF